MTDQKCDHQTCNNTSCYKDTFMVEIWYPKREPDDEGLEEIRYVQVGLMDVRAADDIKIHYDFERDGYVIEQASKFSWKIGEVVDDCWQEVAFIKAWQREVEAE